MKLSFVGAVLLISVLGTDAQGYAGSQSYSVSTNYNPQPADPNNVPNLLPPLPPPPPGYSGYSVSTNYNSQRPEPRPYNFPASAQVSYSRPEGNTGYRVDTYFGSPNQQYPPPPPPPPPPSPSSFFGDILSTFASLAHKPVSLANDMLGSFKDWLSAQSEPSSRPYPYNSQAVYNGPPPFASSQVGVPPGPYNGLPPLPPPPPPPFISQVGVPSYPYNVPPPPPPPVSNQVGAPSNSYNGPPPPLASIQVTGSSDSNSGPPPANSQTYNVRVPAPPQNAM